MAEPLYVPVLPVRQHARMAYEDVRPDIQAAIAPLWNLPPCPGVPPSALTKARWQKELNKVRGAHRRHPGWLDAPFAEEAQVPALAEILSECTGLSRLLRPVTGPERGRAQQSAALATAHRYGCGVGIRVGVPGEWDGRTTEAVGQLLGRAAPDVPVDLLLDLGSVLPGRPDAGKEALRALDALRPLTTWRTAAVLGGSFPRATDDMLELGELREEPRADWHMWSEVQASGRDYLSRLTYGDYGVQSVTALAQVQGGGGPPWGLLRYTTDDWFVLCKVLNSGPDRTASIRAAARRIRDLPEFRGASAGAGETWLRDCADGPLSSSKGTGQVLDWLRAGNVQHMSYVVRCLLGR
ncbi:beta family protein [Streptomyces malaysiensis subsp. malaysiensis]|uniref:beta family protein n=1 Tax=Streptomyces malaysiensis TaxID=92644 RepID=UPI0024C04DC1|nr:beta family protein [Streptomyces sp. NA07423]WHX18578.1 beta family protein [Streptomyces sp. NA07423]